MSILKILTASLIISLAILAAASMQGIQIEWWKFIVIYTLGAAMVATQGILMWDNDYESKSLRRLRLSVLIGATFAPTMFSPCGPVIVTPATVITLTGIGCPPVGIILGVVPILTWALSTFAIWSLAIHLRRGAQPNQSLE